MLGQFQTALLPSACATAGPMATNAVFGVLQPRVNNLGSDLIPLFGRTRLVRA